MKKKLLIGLLILGVIAYGGYRYMYHGHRDIASEAAGFSVSVAELQQEFSKNPESSNKKYLDKTIEVYGNITEGDLSDHTLIVDEKLSATLMDSTQTNSLEVGKQIKIKGRFLGYDDLLEEFKLDQAAISQ
ncbi:MAG: hypothetical protein CFE23_08870 [Flavobacterium sp. BFFFF1]|uniref:OB-fold protein n=1 Tax=unclassified Flavobacterium TaxID=196869 RepID=UPI000BD1B033|nr:MULTISPECIES: hypothetical protein [unclassified Flavobacterium]OYU80581.1 MAG: hypothetical protein CFE23_08870 [Flavobacterium sp. BFFFF1]